MTTVSQLADAVTPLRYCSQSNMPQHIESSGDDSEKYALLIHPNIIKGPRHSCFVLLDANIVEDITARSILNHSSSIE
jgi:hypothetical protein